MIDEGTPDGYSFTPFVHLLRLQSALTPHYYSDALTALGIQRYCCRRMILTHVDLIEKLLKYVPGIDHMELWRRMNDKHQNRQRPRDVDAQRAEAERERLERAARRF